jgi:hypothetical protein
VKETGEEQTVWEKLQARLVAFLAEHGVVDVTIGKAAEPPQLQPKSGKFQQVWSESESARAGSGILTGVAEIERASA